MLLVDSEIKTFLLNSEIDGTAQTWIKNGREDCVTNIGYDLRAARFAKNKSMQESCELNPGESVFVESEEVVRFDNNTCGIVSLKNSRIRMGFTLDAPTYQPGHTTKIYFRLTNVSNDVLVLSAGERYAMLMFQQLEKAPEVPYQGAFEKEFSFKGLGDYKSQYAEQIKSIDGKIKDLKTLEKSIYGNVISLLSVFVAVFTLLNVNISLAQGSARRGVFLLFNLAVLGSISFLSLFMDALIHKEKTAPKWLWIFPILCFAAIFVLAFLPI